MPSTILCLLLLKALCSAGRLFAAEYIPLFATDLQIPWRPDNRSTVRISDVRMHLPVLT